MTNYLKTFTLVVIVFLTSCSFAQPKQIERSGQPALAFVGVNVITMTREGLLRDHTVLVENGKITRIGRTSSIRLPRASIRIDGKGKYLMPGLVDFHVHLRDNSELLSYLAHGVTTIVHMSGPMENVSDTLKLRQQIADGKVLGPTLFATGRILDGDPPIFPGVSTTVSTPEEAKRAVEEQYRAGVDFIKVYNNLKSDVLRVVIKAAHERKLAVLGHIPRRDGRDTALQTSLEAGLDMIAHSEELFFTYFYGDMDSRLDRGLPPQPDKSKIPIVVEMLRKSGTAVTPNLSFVAMTRRQLDDLNAVLSDEESKYLHPDVVSLWRTQNPTRRSDLARFEMREKAKYSFLQELARALQTGGVLLLLGTDSSTSGMYPGKSAHLELQELVKAGLTPGEAISAGTRNAGQFIKSHVRGSDSFGTIAVDQQADLILLDANPLDSIDNIGEVAGVTVRGRWLSKAELERIRNDAANSFDR